VPVCLLVLLCPVYEAIQRAQGNPGESFVDVKINATDLLPREIQRKKKGTVWISGVCDPYQPLEARYGTDQEMP